ncbi:uncharacterized protein LOC142587871 isoform X1 [Dermacentor variabilis]|uniref:uncharacterized protein LOC142587871 isoform X1 n=1 Tax=Dermacentor variabilis TaxID=34621 RepID=UPI003F5BB602
MSCASCADEEQVDASAEGSLVSFVASVRGKRRVLHMKNTKQVHASQVGKTPSSVREATANPTVRQQAEEPAVVLARKVRGRKGRPTASGEAPEVLLARTRAKRATQGKRRELSPCVQLRKQRDVNDRKENGRRQVAVRWSPAPAKRRTRRVSKTLVPKKPALSRTRSASNKKASKDQVSTSSDVIGAAEHHSLLGVSRDGAPFCGPVVFASVLPPAVAVEGGRQPLLNCDATDPQRTTGHDRDHTLPTCRWCGASCATLVATTRSHIPFREAHLPHACQPVLPAQAKPASALVLWSSHGTSTARPSTLWPCDICAVLRDTCA